MSIIYFTTAIKMGQYLCLPFSQYLYTLQYLTYSPPHITGQLVQVLLYPEPKWSIQKLQNSQHTRNEVPKIHKSKLQDSFLYLEVLKVSNHKKKKSQIFKLLPSYVLRTHETFILTLISCASLLKTEFSPLLPNNRKIAIGRWKVHPFRIN